MGRGSVEKRGACCFHSIRRVVSLCLSLGSLADRPGERSAVGAARRGRALGRTPADANARAHGSVAVLDA
ncbi:hypothetical protein C473_06544 [Halorubrum distributum JCM 10247]|uniref:Uncharacterized protein n=1 Tax=Halorubrum distributum JCM 10247 TaxID=1227486 RepID=M0DH71_9EURY|nr:hypothetical protein C473_06544 [Halorubrum terrestre JCM 10247]OYR85034.1 hypothetical protein DJ72_04700 [Halorubrum distributum]